MKLFEPVTIRSLTLKNRIVLAPMARTAFVGSKRARAYFGELALGGVGAITVGGTSPNVFVSDDYWGHPGGAAEFIQRVKALPEAIHGDGASIGVQLLHANRWPDRGPARGDGEPVAPSSRIEGDPPTVAGLIQTGDRLRELTCEEIEYIVDAFGRAAAAVKEAGFDFVQLHLSHGYMPNQFFSPFHNRRRDRYGGDLKGRMRFGIECITTMRQAIGDDYPLFCNLGVEERLAGGITLGDSLEYAVQLVKAGVDVMAVDIAESVPNLSPTSDYPMGTFAHLAEAVKHHVNVPVIALGRINTPEVAEAILASGKADMISIGRQLIADPYWPDKAKEGRIDEIVPCVSCNRCHDGIELRCTVNPAASREEEYRIVPAEKPKRVWVIGGGPGGMEAARVAALRGHQVTLFERSDRLGGQLNLVGVLSHRDVIRKLAGYLAHQVEKVGVEVKLNNEVNAQAVVDGKPEVVVLATGATAFVPDISGVDRDSVVLADDVLAGRREVGDDVAVIGGNQVGCDVALFLAENGKRVTLVARTPVIAPGIIPWQRPPLLGKLVARGVTMLTGVREEWITETGLDIIDTDGERQTIKVDSIVLAAGRKPEDSLARILTGKVAALYSIGDCVEPRDMREAIADGARIGREI